MESTIVISPRIIGRMKNMPVEERKVMLDTLLCDEILGIERSTQLTPAQEMVYFMFRSNVMNESRRYANNKPAQTFVS